MFRKVKGSSSDKAEKKYSVLHFLVVTYFVLICQNLIGQNYSVFDKCTVKLNSQIAVSSQSRNPNQNKFFNYNPVILPEWDMENKGKYDDVIGKESSVFLVFASKSKEENEIVDISCGKTKIKFTDKRVAGNKEFVFNNERAEKGLILSYIFDIEHSKRKNFLKVHPMSDPGDSSAVFLLEFLYFPEILPVNERRIVESYLSIKHGISLDGKVDYFNSDTLKIWDALLNNDYNFRVTGIGRDDKTGLYQKQSYNSDYKGLSLGINQICSTNQLNKADIDNLTFILWGDNGKANNFIKTSFKDIFLLERSWAVQKTSETMRELFLQVKLDTKPFSEDQSLQSNSLIWLVKFDPSNSLSKAEFSMPQNSATDFAIYNNVDFNNTEKGSSKFTFMRAPRMFALADTNPNSNKCNKSGSIDLRIIGGQEPFKINISGLNLRKEIFAEQRNINIKDFHSGVYTYSITDNIGNMYESNFTIETGQNKSQIPFQNISLGSEGVTEIVPGLFSDEKIQEYTWYCNGIKISNDSVLTTSKPGEYYLETINNNGCKSQYNFKINEYNSQPEEVIIYPNPVIVNNIFTVQLLLKDISDVEIVIYDISGKILKTSKWKDIGQHKFQEQINIPGTYKIIIKTPSHTYTKQLVVV